MPNVKVLGWRMCSGSKKQNFNRDYIVKKREKACNSAITIDIKNRKIPILDIHLKNIYAKFQGSRLNDVIRVGKANFNRDYKVKKGKKACNSAIKTDIKNLEKLYLDIYLNNIFANFQASRLNNVVRVIKERIQQ